MLMAIKIIGVPLLLSDSGLNLLCVIPFLFLTILLVMSKIVPVSHISRLTLS